MTQARYLSWARSAYASGLGRGRAAVASRPSASSSAATLASASGCSARRYSVQARLYPVVSNPAKKISPISPAS